MPLPHDIYAPETNDQKTPRAIAILTGNGVEDLEFFYPYYRFIEAGFKVDVVTSQGGELKGKQGLTLKETKKIPDVHAEHYELLYLPGGKAPEELKKNQQALALVDDFFTGGKPIAAICHGPQILAAANLVEGKKIAAWPEVSEEIERAGGIYIDCETVVDEPFITARWPGDLPAHVKRTLDILGDKQKEYVKDDIIEPHAAA